MYLIILLILAIIFFADIWPLVLLFIIGIVAVIIWVVIRSRSNESVSEDTYETTGYKIGADVGSSLYNEVKQYCNKHHMTISDLIRKSVRAYMDTNK